AEAARARRSFAQRRAFNEMAARRSFHRSLGKFEPQFVDKPVAILTAWRGEVALADNRKANARLGADLQTSNLGFYPVKGAGQEERSWLFGRFLYVVPSSEESFVVQPRADMSEGAFVSVIQGLLHSTLAKNGVAGLMDVCP